MAVETLTEQSTANQTLYVLSQAPVVFITAALLVGLAIHDALSRSRPWQGIVLAAIIIVLHIAQFWFTRTVLTTTAVEQRRWNILRRLVYRDVERATVSGGKYLIVVYLTTVDGRRMRIRGPNYQVLRALEILKEKISPSRWEIV
jgi:hypothetical protein